jgi:hypothetical protein
MRVILLALCTMMICDASAAATKKKVATAERVLISKAPKGCFEKSWNRSELKKLPLQKVTAVRIDVNTGAQPSNQPAVFGKVQAKFRDSGDSWLSTDFECSDTGVGFACATHCDSSIFVLSPGLSGLQLLPQKVIAVFGGDCEGSAVSLKMNADQVPFALSRRSTRACPTP